VKTAKQTTQDDIITALREQARRIEGAKRPEGGTVVSTGCDDLDRLFPENGIRRGSLIEWHGKGQGSGAGSLALITARQACADGGALVVIDREGTFFPPSALSLGIDRERLVVVRPANARDELWAIDQSLRCEAVSAVWGYVERLAARSFRRLQLSAEAGSGVGLFVRPLAMLGQPSWSDVRLLVEPLPAGGRSPQFRVEIVRCHIGRAGSSAAFEVDEAGPEKAGAIVRKVSHETRALHLDSQLAHSAGAYRKTGTE